MEKKKSSYKALFFKSPKERAREGKLTYVRKEYHERICRLLLFLNDDNSSIYGFIDNVLQEHFALHKGEIEKLYELNNKPLFSPEATPLPEEGTDNYRKLFFKEPDISGRKGKLTYLRSEYHELICRLLLLADNGRTSIYGFIDNVLAEHFNRHRKVISEMYAESQKPIFLSD